MNIKFMAHIFVNPQNQFHSLIARVKTQTYYWNYRWSDSIISVWLLPFVSGINMMRNIVKLIPIRANKYMLQWNPNVSVKIGKYFKLMNANKKRRMTQNETQASLIFSGIISETIVSVNAVMPIEEIKFVYENVTSGMKLRCSSWMPFDLSII